MTISNPDSHSEAIIQPGSVFRIAVILLGAAIAVIPFELFLAFQLGAWQMFAAAGALFAFGAAILISIGLIRRDRPGLGIGIILAGIMVIFPVASSLIADLGLVFGLTLVLVNSTIAAQTLPPKYIRRVILVSLAAGVATLLLDMFGGDYRLVVPVFQSFIQVAATIALLGILIGRQFLNYSLRTKILVTLIGVAIITATGLGYVATQTLQTALTAQIGETYTSKALNLSSLVNAFFKEKVTQIVIITLNDMVKDQLEERNQNYTGSADAILDEIRTLDLQWVAADDDDPLIHSIITPDPAVNPTAFQLADYLEPFPDHREIFVTDRYGAALAATGRLSDYYQADEGWWQAAWNDGQGAIYISDPEFDESARVTTSLIAVPVFDEETGEVIGIVRSTLVLDELFAIIETVKFGETGHAVLFDSAARVLFEPAGEEDLEELAIDLRQRLVGEKAGFEIATGIDGDQSIFAHAPITSHIEPVRHETELSLDIAIANLGWAIVIRQETGEAFASTTQLIQNTRLATVAILALVGLLGLFVARFLTRPILALTTAAEAMGAGNLDTSLPQAGGDEIGRLTTSFGDMAAQLRDLIGTLEQRVAARTHDLEQRSTYLEAAAEVSRAVAAILNPDPLIRKIVDLIRERFNLYYVGLFMVDEAGEWAILRAGTGEAGRAMLAREHRIKIGEGVIGWSVANAQARVARESGEDAVRLATTELPQTRSEAAIPLRAREQVIGALTVQDTRPGSFDETTMTVLQTMADQVAIAITNAQLYETSQAALEAERRAYGVISREAWLETLRARAGLGYRYDRVSVTPIKSAWQPEMHPTAQRGEISKIDRNGRQTLVVPITMHGQAIGVINLEKRVAGEPWTEKEIALLESLTGQLGIALDSARLHEETQQRAEQER
ncbi:MAG: GAF domain-containing protein, partial [Anaerolineales bacterium]